MEQEHFMTKKEINRILRENAKNETEEEAQERELKKNMLLDLFDMYL